MTRWWFVRHGESTANAQGWLAGHVDAPLTERGVQQAVGLRPALADVRPARVVSSDLVRAVRTCEIAWDDRTPAPEQHVGLRERHLGDWERQPKQVLRADGHWDALLGWTTGPPGGESQRALSVRALGWLAAQEEGHDTLVFAHGGLIRCVVGLLDGTPVDQIGRWQVRNTELVERLVAPGRWRALLDGL